MSTKVGQLKPFFLEEKKEGPLQTVSEATFSKWQGSIQANVRKEEKWAPLLTKRWEPKKVNKRGLSGSTADDDLLQIDLMLAYIAQYAPNALYRDITLRATSVSNVWTLIRQWAGLKSSGCKQHVYFQLKQNFEPNGDITPNDFFFALRNAKEDCLLLSAASGGKVTFHGTLLQTART